MKPTKKMVYRKFSRFEPSLQFLCLLCFALMTVDGADIEPDVVGFLLGRILTNDGRVGRIEDRLDKVEERLDAQSAENDSHNEAFRPDVVHAVVKDAILKANQVSKAFGVEKKNIRVKSEELSLLTAANRNEITKLKDDSNQTSIKMGNLNQSLVQLQEVFQKNEIAGTELDDKFQLEIDGLKDEVGENKKQSQSVSDKIDHNVTKLADLVSDVKSQLNGLTIQTSQDNDEIGQLKQQIETLSSRVTYIQRENDKLNLKLKALTCPSGWSRQRYSCILYVTNQTMNWTDAQEYCKSKQGILAEPYTLESFDLLVRNAPDDDVIWFLGARDHGEEGKWIWESSSTPIELKRWNDGEPNNYGGNENCLEYRHGLKLLEDINCDLTTNAADKKLDVTGFLLGRILANEHRLDIIEDRLDEIEKLLGADSGVKVNNIEAICRDIIDTVAKDSILKAYQVSEAFGVEKKNIREMSEELSLLTTATRNEITKLKDDTNQVYAKMSHLNQSIIQLQDEFQENKIAGTELNDKFQLELDGLKDEVQDNKEQSQSFSDKIYHNITHLADVVSDVKSQLNRLANQTSRDNDENGQLKQQIETLSNRVTDIQRQNDELNLKLKTLITCPSGWSRQLDSCILYVTNQTMNWTDAQEYCRSKQGILAEPYTNESFDLLVRNAPANTDRLFLGARDHIEEGKWIWESSSTPMELKRWNKGEPNNGRGNENCLEYYQSLKLLNDINCGLRFDHIVCEIKI